MSDVLVDDISWFSYAFRRRELYAYEVRASYWLTCPRAPGMYEDYRVLIPGNMVGALSLDG